HFSWTLRRTQSPLALWVSSRVAATSMPAARSPSATRAMLVDLPEPSMPSNAMRRPPARPDGGAASGAAGPRLPPFAIGRGYPRWLWTPQYLEPRRGVFWQGSPKGSRAMQTVRGAAARPGALAPLAGFAGAALLAFFAVLA